MWHMGDGWGWWMAFGWVWMIGFWLLVIWAVTALARDLRPNPERRVQGEPTALELLERRYASGELSDEEFDAKRRTLAESRVRGGAPRAAPAPGNHPEG